MRCLKRLFTLQVFFTMSYNWEIFSKVSLLTEILKYNVSRFQQWTVNNQCRTIFFYSFLGLYSRFSHFNHTAIYSHFSWLVDHAQLIIMFIMRYFGAGSQTFLYEVFTIQRIRVMKHSLKCSEDTTAVSLGAMLITKNFNLPQLIWKTQSWSD